MSSRRLLTGKGMKVYLYTHTLNRDNPKGAVSYWPCKFKDGLEMHGIMNTTFRNPASPPKGCDFAVVWGIRHKHLVDFHKKHDIPLLVIERGFTPPRYLWAMMGWNGLNGLADYCNKDMPSDRWDTYLKGKMLPWNTEGEYVLILGQTIGDSALYGFDVDKWAEDTQQYFAGERIPYVFRPHPGRSAAFSNSVPELDEAVSRASCVITYNSSAGVASILQGKPTIAIHKGSMIWDVAKHNIKDYNKNYIPNRTQWGSNFAYTQWQAWEVERGDAWDHLRSFIT